MSNPIEEKFLSSFDISKKYVVALSGGVDSAVLAFLATKYSKNVRSVFVNHNQTHSSDLEPVSYTHLTLPTILRV